MKKLQFVSIAVLVISIIGLIVWRFFVPFPDWLVRGIGIVLLASIFTSVFSTAKITAKKKNL